MRAAEGRARAAEGRINMLEDDLRQAKAQAATEAAARELLQARTEASEAQLGRLEAQALARHRAAHASELGPKHRGSGSLVNCGLRSSSAHGLGSSLPHQADRAQPAQS